MQSTLIVLLFSLAGCALATLAFPILARFELLSLRNTSLKNAKRWAFVSLAIAAILIASIGLRLSFVVVSLNTITFFACSAGGVMVATFVIKEAHQKALIASAYVTIATLLISSLFAAFFSPLENLNPESTTLQDALLCQRVGYGMAGSDAGEEVHVSRQFGVLRRTVAYARISDYSEHPFAEHPKLIQECITALNAKAKRHDG
jgi:hypothetical protein